MVNGAIQVFTQAMEGFCKTSGYCKDISKPQLALEQFYSLACHAGGPPSNTVFTKAGYIPGPKPAVMSNDTVAGPVSFVLALNGPDALVSFAC